MAPAAVIVLVIAGVARTGLSAPKTRDSYDSIQSRIRQLAEEFNALQDAFEPRHCADLLRNGQHRSGVYTVFHKAAGSSGQNVYCDMDTDGGGWTVIQRRGQYGHNAYYFYRNWTEYANGFGDPDDEYWIGNKALHALTSEKENMSLRIVLSNSTEETVSFGYETFAVANETQSFQLQLESFSGSEEWDAMGHLSGQKFSTYDRDNSLYKVNCAVRFRGGWWYSNCLGGNLNGLNLNGYHDSLGDGIVWEKSPMITYMLHYSYPKVQMMIRPADR